MPDATHVTVARDIMMRFARDTGLSSLAGRPKRYLWTDAFAVCNFLQLYRHSSEDRYRRLALDLVEQVHEVLAKHREDDPRSGWISGLDEAAGRLRPTLGGLRIGKSLGERERDRPMDERLEWERDGQYYHYLTKWMHALHLVARVTDTPECHRWACDLAKIAHSAFVHRLPGKREKRLYWKMSIDLTYPQVTSMSHHDPLDGYVTYREVERPPLDTAVSSPCDLHVEIADLAEMCRQRSWASDDPLGIGGLLFDACRLFQMTAEDTGFDDHGLLLEVLQSAILGLQSFLACGGLRNRPEDRLAFRELGLAIGLHAVPKMSAQLEHNAGFDSHDMVKDQVKGLLAAVPLATSIETFWLSPTNRQAASWRDHEQINMVMLATSLAPDAFLGV